MPNFSDYLRKGAAVLLFTIPVCFHSYSQRPNIIYIMSDDMGYGDLSGYGHKGYTTPNLDKLASQGVKFVNAYAAGPLCTAGGVKSPASSPLDGIDLMSIVTGSKQAIDRTFYWKRFQGNKHKAMRDGNWKYLQDEKGEYLFDLVNDQAEKKDVKETHKDIFDRLKKKYQEWEKTVLQPDESK